MKKVFMGFSGGLDSTALLYHYMAEYGKENIQPVFFRYPSLHNEYELQAAMKIADDAGITLRIVDVTTLFLYTSSGLIDGNIKVGSYSVNNMATTVVPGRNLIFASNLASQCESVGGGIVALGVHAGDHVLYPDCREEWVDALAKILDVQSEGRVALQAPWSAMSKSEIVKRALQLEVPIHLTRSCYAQQSEPCGECGTCIERQRALSDNNITKKVLV